MLSCKVIGCAPYLVAPLIWLRPLFGFVPYLVASFIWLRPLFGLLCAGEPVTINIKNKETYTCDRWPVHVLLIGNTKPPWEDNGFALARRMVVFYMRKVVHQKDGRLASRIIADTLGASLFKYSVTYRDAVSHHRVTDPLERDPHRTDGRAVYPPTIIRFNDSVRTTMNPLYKMLFEGLSSCSEPLFLSPNNDQVFMPLDMFGQQYNEYCTRTFRNMKRQDFCEDVYNAVFNQFGLSVKRDTKMFDRGNGRGQQMVDGNFVFGVGLVSHYEAEAEESMRKRQRCNARERRLADSGAGDLADLADSGAGDSGQAGTRGTRGTRGTQGTRGTRGTRGQAGRRAKANDEDDKDDEDDEDDKDDEDDEDDDEYGLSAQGFGSQDSLSPRTQSPQPRSGFAGAGNSGNSGTAGNSGAARNSGNSGTEGRKRKLVLVAAAAAARGARRTDEDGVVGGLEDGVVGGLEDCVVSGLDDGVVGGGEAKGALWTEFLDTLAKHQHAAEAEMSSRHLVRLMRIHPITIDQLIAVIESSTQKVSPQDIVRLCTCLRGKLQGV